MATKSVSEMTAEERRHEALRHELRAQIMYLLITGGPSYPAQIAKALGNASVDDVNYHTKRLVKLGVVDFVGEQRVDGNKIARVYRAIEPYQIETDEWDDLHPLLKGFHATRFAQAHIDDLVAGFKARTLGTHKNFDLRQKRVTVDEQGRDEIQAIKERAIKEVLEAEAGAANRLAKSNEAGIRLSVLQAAFEIPPAS